MRPVIDVSFLILCAVLTGAQGPPPLSGPILPAQNTNNDVILPPVGKALTGGPCGTTLACTAVLAAQHSYVPTSLTPTKVVEVNFNIVQKSDGTGNWTSTLADLAALGQLKSWANDYFHLYLCSPTDPCPGVVYPTDSRIQISLEHIYFYQDDTLWASNNAVALLTAAFTAHPDAAQHLNIFFTGGTYMGASAFALTPSDDRSYDQAVVMLNATSSNGTWIAMAATSTMPRSPWP